ncbi:MAG: sugar ABC transporter permease [Clostridiales bacterium]|nr:sugar ABC transporter permease [Clostridiales bacterium]
MKKKLVPYAMTGPAMVFLILFTFYPLVNLVYLNFFDYNLISEKSFVGLDNYYRLFFVNVDFWNAFRNTIVYTVAVVVLLIVFALIFALWLQKSTWLNGLAQRIMFLPHICAMLSVSMVFQWMMDEQGLFNAVLNIFNLPGLRWLNSSDTALISVIIVSVWKNAGYYALILLSSLKAIPAEINEAAALDDARPLQKFFKITLPMLSPQVFFLLVTITIGSFKVFESVRVMTNGGLGDSTDVLVFYIYRYAFQSLKVGYASAAGTVLLVILMLLTVVYFRLMGRRVHYQ